MMLMGAAPAGCAFEESVLEAAGASLPCALVCLGADFFESFAAVFFAAGASVLADLLTLVSLFFWGALLFGSDGVLSATGLDVLGEAFFFGLGIPEQVMKTIVPTARNVAAVKGAGDKGRAISRSRFCRSRISFYSSDSIENVGLDAAFRPEIR